jgi:hypothetical protein
VKIAIQNSWPNLAFSAEKEFVTHFKIAGQRLGWEVVEVVTSDDIYAVAPDVVLATAERTRLAARQIEVCARLLGHGGLAAALRHAVGSGRR